MQSEVMFAGFGGQGILSSAKILAYAAMKEGHLLVGDPARQWLNERPCAGVRSSGSPGKSRCSSRWRL